MFSRITVNKSWIGQLGAKEVRGLTSDATHNGLTPIRHIMSVKVLHIASDESASASSLTAAPPIVFGWCAGLSAVRCLPDPLFFFTLSVFYEQLLVLQLLILCSIFLTHQSLMRFGMNDWTHYVCISGEELQDPLLQSTL